jgi:hypothetical protein
VAKPGSKLWRLIEDNPLEWGMSTGWALHLRRLTTGLLQTLTRAHRVFPQIDPGVNHVSKNEIFVFRSGYRCQFGHCKDPSSYTIYMSQEYTHLGLDELFEFEEEQYDQLSTRVRSADPVLRHFLKIRAMSNPMMRAGEGIKVLDPFWVRRRFVEPCPEGNKVIEREFSWKEPDGTRRRDFKTSIYMPATIDDNPDKEFVEQYKRRLAFAKPHIREALLYGNWWYVIGSFYGDAWNPAIHVVEPFRIPSHWRVFRSMDWGFKTKGVVLWVAMDDDENLWVIKEYTFRLKHVDEVAEDIREIEIGLKLWDKEEECSKIMGVADNQLWEERGDVVMTKAEHFEDLGIGWLPADKRSRKRNAELLISRLRDHAEGTETPGIVFFDRCPGCVTTIPTIPEKADDPECPEDQKGDDHHDAVLYACAFASYGSVSLPAAPDEREDEEEGQRRVMSRRSGRYGYGQPAC